MQFHVGELVGEGRDGKPKLIGVDERILGAPLGGDGVVERRGRVHPEPALQAAQGLVRLLLLLAKGQIVRAIAHEEMPAAGHVAVEGINRHFAAERVRGPGRHADAVREVGTTDVREDPKRPSAGWNLGRKRKAGSLLRREAHLRAQGRSEYGYCGQNSQDCRPCLKFLHQFSSPHETSATELKGREPDAPPFEAPLSARH